MTKVMTMSQAITTYVKDGMTLAIEGFTAFICFAAGHEIIRQRKRDLTLCRMTPDLLYDQMIAAGTARKLVFSYLGNPGVGSLHCIRRAVEKGIPDPIEIEEYSHFGMIGRYLAGASQLPFFPLRSYQGSDLPEVNDNIRFLENPYGPGSIAVVPPLKLDACIIHAQRADDEGSTQAWGILGVQQEAAYAADRVIVVVEELVDTDVIRADPNRTILPGMVVDAVVVEPYGAYPSYVQGFYDRDNEAYLAWDELSRDRQAVEAWLDEWVYGRNDRQAYLQHLPEGTLARLKPGRAKADPVDYGVYQ